MRVLIPFDHLPQTGVVPLHRLLAGPDEGLEPELLPVGATPRSRRPRGELSDGEPQEVETGPVTLLAEGVTDPGLTRLQLQPHLAQPLGHDLLALLNDRPV